VAGLIEQAAFCGAPEQASVTLPLRAALPVSVKLNVAGWPLGTVLVKELPLPGPMLMEGAAPIPLSATVCGLFGALPVIVSTAERLPASDGRKLILTLQLLPPLMVVHCPEATLKSAALVPLIANPEMVRSWLLASEIDSGRVLLVPVETLPKSRPLGAPIASGVYAVPVSGMELVLVIPDMETVRLPV